MLNICDDISEIEYGYANIAHKYAMSASFGRKTDLLFSDMLIVNFYLKVLDRNQTTYTRTFANIPLEGQKVSFSSLKKQNNNLILDTEHFSYCSESESRSCLSDEEICVIVERAKTICYKYN